MNIFGIFIAPSSGFWWCLAGLVAYLGACFCIVCLCKIAGRADKDMGWK